MSARDEEVANPGSVSVGLPYQEPTSQVTELDVQPRLESWERSYHPDQIALRRYVDHVHDLIVPALREHEDGELSLRLVVGLPTDAPLVGAGGDLDNYLFPLMRRLGGDRFASAWAIKHHGPSTIALHSARTASTEELRDWNHATVQTTESAERRAWKEQIAAQLPSQPGATDRSNCSCASGSAPAATGLPCGSLRSTRWVPSWVAIQLGPSTPATTG